MLARASLLAAVLTLGLGCDKIRCDRQSVCENDPIPTPAARDACRNAIDANQNSACEPEVLSYGDCAGNNVVCGSDGKTDATFTATKVTNNCKAQLDARNACCAQHSTATACGNSSSGNGNGGSPSPDAGSGPVNPWDAVASQLCDVAPACPNDVITQAMRDACKSSIVGVYGSVCFDAWRAGDQCALAHRLCGADGKYDDAASKAHLSDYCSPQVTTYYNCCTANPTSPACR